MDIVERIHAELPITRVNVRIDSKYVLNNMLHRQRYVNNGWITSQGQPLANNELWIKVTARLEELSVLGIRWTAEWVKGHSDFFGNILADREASKALVAATNNFFTEQFTISPAQGYWTTANKGSIATIPAHYFLTDTTWFHNTLTGHIERDDGLHVMFTGTFKEDETIGQPNSNTGCGVVLIKEKPEHLTALEQIAKNLDRVDNGLETYGVFTGNLNVLMNPGFVRDINGRPEQFLIMNRNRKQFLAVDKKEVLARVHPPELAFEQMDKFDKIYATLERVVSGELFKHECLTDITDLIYEVTKGPKKTTTKLLLGNDPAFKVPVNVIVYDSNHVYKTIVSNCILTHGITTPRRRVFSGLKDHNVRVYVLTAFDAFIGFRYYTVIHLDSDEWGIWTNPAANLRTL
ncbi:MAG: hypothetical protein [Bacteriophage sp.]|nr:MAG: hypothetical protein [Bacteriophage sp.]